MSDPAPADTPRPPGQVPASDPPAAPTSAPTNPAPTTLPPPVTFVSTPQPQRPNIGSLLFLTAFFFFMNNNQPAPIMVGPDGQIVPRETQLDRARERVQEYGAFMNTTYGGGAGGHGAESNATRWVEERVGVRPESMLPTRYRHPGESLDGGQGGKGGGGGGEFYRNITGFWRDAAVHVVDLETGHPGTSGKNVGDGFWHGVHFPLLDRDKEHGGAFNTTEARRLRGGFEWDGVYKWEMNLRERVVLMSSEGWWAGQDEGGAGRHNSTGADGRVSHGNGHVEPHWQDWHWIKGSATLYTKGKTRPIFSDGAGNGNGNGTWVGNTFSPDSVNYEFNGLHHVPNGTYALFAQPEGHALDIRNIPRLYTDPAHQEVARRIVMRELRFELEKQEQAMLLSDVRPEEYTPTSCPLLIHLALPPLPATYPRAALDAYEEEQSAPTGLLASMRAPPPFWAWDADVPGGRVGMGGIVVADGCGIVMGVDRGKGVGLEDFWARTVRYASYITLAQLALLVLLVRQMERTRTPSALARVSVFTVAIPSIMDSWLFSAHLVFGLMSDNKAGLPLLIPGFLSLLSAVVFGPRYAVLLWRIQAPERAVETPPPRPRAAAAVAVPAGDVEAGAVQDAIEPEQGVFARARDAVLEEPRPVFAAIGLVVVLVFIIFASDALLPVLTFGLYSFWVPQIWRSAKRGTGSGMDGVYILGTTAGRLALPIYIIAFPDNILFIKAQPWVWGLLVWQALQVMVLLAQQRFGPSFFLPASYQPAESYNYHPLLPAHDVEDPDTTEGATGDAGADPETNEDAKAPLLAHAHAHAHAEDKTCSICMEHVDTRPHHTSGLASAAGEALALAGMGLGDLGARRTYALAPCGHLFHTACLAQWMSVKTICPLCKRSLPPL